ncbi:hypothetical protein [Marinobacter pelagius]|uniref:hypothetical protein n=1 Tax=Marinobacter pelagius TaxID=379482 RepID=UPI0011BF90E8|nr:hypothetical protein [Marinobacter pelagius]
MLYQLSYSRYVFRGIASSTAAYSTDYGSVVNTFFQVSVLQGFIDQTLFSAHARVNAYAKVLGFSWWKEYIGPRWKDLAKHFINKTLPSISKSCF